MWRIFVERPQSRPVLTARLPGRAPRTTAAAVGVTADYLIEKEIESRERDHARWFEREGSIRVRSTAAVSDVSAEAACC
jgi:hypothetical protein